MTVVGPQSGLSSASARRGLRALLGATGVSSVGDGAFLAAAPLAAAAITRDPTAVAAVLAAEHLPWVLVSPFAGVYVDRWPKRTTMMIADVLRAGAVGALAVMVGLGMATVPTIALCAAAIVTGMVFHSAAAEAVVADLTGRDEQLLHTVNGRLQAANTAGRQLVGPPTGSWSFTITGWLPFVADAVSFLASAALIAAVPRQRAEPRAKTRMWPALREGITYVLGHRNLRTLALLTAAGNVAVNMAMATLVLYATDPSGLDITAAAYGLLLSAMAVGGIIGGFLAQHIIGWLGNRLTVTVGFLVQATTWLVVAATREPVVAGVAVCILWISIAPVTVVIIGTRQRQTPPKLLGRVISAYRIVGNGLAPLGAIIGGVVASAWGLRAPMIAATTILIIAVIPAVRGLPDGANRSR
ncbi:MAG: MFS transporter [Pseudonocardiaceae bacterium]